jgi:hypothetical protein
MIGTHGRDRPVLADAGGVGVHARRPLRLSNLENISPLSLEPSFPLEPRRALNSHPEHTQGAA